MIPIRDISITTLFSNDINNPFIHLVQCQPCYPGTLDNGNYMEITNSIGLISTEYLNNTIIGSNMGGGSSGGPWIINFGYAPTLTGAGKPSGYNQNTVVGVTSWGYNSTDVMQMGASPFLSSNLGALITSACSNKYAGCL